MAEFVLNVYYFIGESKKYQPFYLAYNPIREKEEDDKKKFVRSRNQYRREYANDGFVSNSFSY